MNASIKIWMFLAAMAGATAIAVPALAADQPAKVGVVDLQQCLNESTMGKKYKGEFTAEAEKMKAELEKEEGELAALREEIDTQGVLLAEEIKAAKDKEYKEKVSVFKEKFQSSQQALQRRDQELTRKILRDLQGIVREIGEKEGYSLIVERNEAGVLFAPGQSDLTDKIIQMYDKSAPEKK